LVVAILDGIDLIELELVCNLAVADVDIPYYASRDEEVIP